MLPQNDGGNEAYLIVQSEDEDEDAEEDIKRAQKRSDKEENDDDDAVAEAAPAPAAAVGGDEVQMVNERDLAGPLCSADDDTDDVEDMDPADTENTAVLCKSMAKTTPSTRRWVAESRQSE